MTVQKLFLQTIQFGTTSYTSSGETLEGDIVVKLEEEVAAGATNTYEVTVDPAKLQGFAIGAGSAGLDIDAGGDELLGGTTSFAEVRGWNKNSGETNPFTATRSIITVENTAADPVSFKMEILLANA